MLYFILGGDISVSEIFGKRLKKEREANGWTQEYMASLIGITNGALSGYERDYREPDQGTFIKICKLLNVTSDYLLGITDSNLLNKKVIDDINLENIHLPIAAGTQNDKNKGLDPELLKEIKEEIRSAILEVREERKNEQYGKK